MKVGEAVEVDGFTITRREMHVVIEHPTGHNGLYVYAAYIKNDSIVEFTEAMLKIVKAMRSDHLLEQPKEH